MDFPKRRGICELACLLMNLSASFLSANQVNICLTEDRTRSSVEVLKGLLLNESVFAPLKSKSELTKSLFWCQ